MIDKITGLCYNNYPYLSAIYFDYLEKIRGEAKQNEEITADKVREKAVQYNKTSSNFFLNRHTDNRHYDLHMRIVFLR